MPELMNKKNKKNLEGLYLVAFRNRYPTVPENSIPPLQLKDNSTNALTKSVIAFLKWSGHQAERISNTGRMIPGKKIVTDVVGFQRTIGSDKYIKGTGTNGTADISGTICAASVKIEIKFGADRQSADQKKYQADIESAGGIYIIVKTFDGFIEDYEKLIRTLRPVHISPSGIKFVVINPALRTIQKLDNFEIITLNEKQFAPYSPPRFHPHKQH